MRVLILNGSPRPNGNTKQMIRAFCEGLEEAGHAFDELDICRMNVHGCLACEYCHGKGNGQCVQKDDMGKVYHALGEADMLVIASPIYYHGLTGQLKCCIDRFYAALYPKKPMKLCCWLPVTRICTMVPCSPIRETFWIIWGWKTWA